MKHLEKQSGKAIDLLICCGDFQVCTQAPPLPAPRHLSQLLPILCRLSETWTISSAWHVLQSTEPSTHFGSTIQDVQQHLTRPCSVRPASGEAFLSPLVTSQLPGVALPAVGGNHEAMNYLWELYYGGWVAPNIYYLGHAGVVKFGGIRIGGMSGIFNGGHYKQVSCACLGNKVQGICPFVLLLFILQPWTDKCFHSGIVDLAPKVVVFNVQQLSQ